MRADYEMETQDEEVAYCTWHPKVETSLHCYQCDRPICFKCAKRTPVGYICKECERGRKGRYEQARISDYLIATVVSLILSAIAAPILPSLGWFTIFLSPLVGTLIAEAVWRLIGRRYGSRLWWVVAASIVVGSLPALIGPLVSFFFTEAPFYGALSLLWLIVHIALAIGSATARLRLR
ncbi:MAG: hypothetical protein ACLFU8_17050 [Anaerolineales bacterium]